MLLSGVRRGRAASVRALLLVSLMSLAHVAAESQTRRTASVKPNSTTESRNSSRRELAPAKLAEYRARVRRAYELLERLALVYEGGAVPEPGGARARGGPEDVAALLPERERVEWGAGFVEVDNEWLHEALKKLEAEEDDEKIAAGLRVTAGRLRALETRLAELEGSGTESVDRDAERGRLNSILRAPEFDRQAPPKGNALQRLLEDFMEWLASLFPKGGPVVPGASPRASMLTQFLVFGLCLAVLVYVVRRIWLRRGLGRKSLGLKRGPRVVLGERLEAEQTAADLLEEAERLARGGELRGAIRKAYVALLCELGDRGVVRLAQHKTNRDYLDAVRRAARPRLYTEMLPLTSDFELHWYGLHDASESDWESFKTRCRRAISESVASS